MCVCIYIYIYLLITEEQFRKLDTYYSTVGDEHKQRWVAVEERILCYQRQLEERSKHDLQLEVCPEKKLIMIFYILMLQF